MSILLSFPPSLSFLVAILLLTLVNSSLYLRTVNAPSSTVQCDTLNNFEASIIHCDGFVIIVTQISNSSFQNITYLFNDTATSPRVLLTDDKSIILARDSYIMVLKLDTNETYTLSSMTKRYELLYDPTASVIVEWEFVIFKAKYGCSFSASNWKFPTSETTLNTVQLFTESTTQNCEANFLLYQKGTFTQGTSTHGIFVYIHQIATFISKGILIGTGVQNSEIIQVITGDSTTETKHVLWGGVIADAYSRFQLEYTNNTILILGIGAGVNDCIFSIKSDFGILYYDDAICFSESSFSALPRKLHKADMNIFVSFQNDEGQVQIDEIVQSYIGLPIKIDNIVSFGAISVIPGQQISDIFLEDIVNSPLDLSFSSDLLSYSYTSQSICDRAISSFGQSNYYGGYCSAFDQQKSCSQTGLDLERIMQNYFTTREDCINTIFADLMIKASCPSTCSWQPSSCITFTCYLNYIQSIGCLGIDPAKMCHDTINPTLMKVDNSKCSFVSRMDNYTYRIIKNSAVVGTRNCLLTMNLLNRSSSDGIQVSNYSSIAFIKVLDQISRTESDYPLIYYWDRATQAYTTTTLINGLELNSNIGSTCISLLYKYPSYGLSYTESLQESHTYALMVRLIPTSQSRDLFENCVSCFQSANQTKSAASTYWTLDGNKCLSVAPSSITEGSFASSIVQCSQLANYQDAGCKQSTIDKSSIIYGSQTTVTSSCRLISKPITGKVLVSTLTLKPNDKFAFQTDGKVSSNQTSVFQNGLTAGRIVFSGFTTIELYITSQASVPGVQSFPQSMFTISYESDSGSDEYGDETGLSPAIKLLLIMLIMLVVSCLFCICMYYRISKEMSAESSSLKVQIPRRRAQSENIKRDVDVFSPSIRGENDGKAKFGQSDNPAGSMVVFNMPTYSNLYRLLGFAKGEEKVLNFEDDQINLLMKYKIRFKVGLPDTEGEGEGEVNCVLCQEPLASKEYRIMLCGIHFSHTDCFETWLNEQVKQEKNHFCPGKCTKITYNQPNGVLFERKISTTKKVKGKKQVTIKEEARRRVNTMYEKMRNQPSLEEISEGSFVERSSRSSRSFQRLRNRSSLEGTENALSNNLASISEASPRAKPMQRMVLIYNSPKRKQSNLPPLENKKGLADIKNKIKRVEKQLPQTTSLDDSTMEQLMLPESVKHDKMQQEEFMSKLQVKSSSQIKEETRNRLASMAEKRKGSFEGSSFEDEDLDSEGSNP